MEGGGVEQPHALAGTEYDILGVCARVEGNVTGRWRDRDPLGCSVRGGVDQSHAVVVEVRHERQVRGWVDSGQLQAHLPTPAAPVAHTPAPQQGVIPAPASAATPPAASAASPAAPAVSADATPAPPQPAATPPVTHPAGADASLANTPVRGATPAEPAPEMLNPF